MNKYKKWTISMISATLAFLVLFGLGTYITDPLLRYRKESGLFSYWHYTEIYSNPGVARQYDYDSVLVGSSMVEKTNVEQVGKIWDSSLVNLPYSGGTAYNMKTILDICFENNSDIKNVYWSLDEYALTVDPDTPRYPLPEYLYKEDHLDDLSYLLNADVFYFYTVKNILGTLRGESKLAMPLNQPESIDYSLYGKEKVLASYAPAKEKAPVKDDYYLKRAKENLEQNILPLLKAHPKTTFRFFLPPYSIIYWQNELRGGTLDATIKMLDYTFEALLGYENTEVYFFQAEEDIITNLDNYRDYTHFKPELNTYMAQQISENKNRVEKGNYKELLQGVKAFAEQYDYSKVLPGK